MQTASFFLLCLLVMTVPWEDNFYIPGLTSIARLLGVLVCAFGLLAVAMRGRIRTPPAAFLSFALFIVWCVAATAWSIDSEATFDRAKTYVLLFVFVWLIWELADTPRRQLSLMRAFVLGTAFLVLNVYTTRFLKIGVEASDMERATAENANPNAVSMLACLAIEFAYFLIIRREPGRFELPKWFYWGFIVVAGLVVPMTGSRAGFITALIVGLTFVPVLRQSMRKSGWKNAAVLLLVAAALAVLIPRFVSQELQRRLVEGTTAHTFEERFDAWKRGIDVWRQTPLLGVGPGTYRIAGISGDETQRVAHNTFVSVLVETGIIGSLLYSGFWLFVLRAVWRLPKGDRYFWVVFLASMLPALLTGSAEYYKPCWLVGAVVMCQGANLRPSRPRRGQPPVFRVRAPAPGTPRQPPASAQGQS